MARAPVVLFVYNRPEHTKKTIEALQNNYLARETDLFVFSDGAKNDDAVPQVNQIRNYLKTVEGFKSIHVIERKKNYGLAKNIIYGVTKIIDLYNKVIVLEDDILTSEYFLTYMNRALDKYYDHTEVMSISGYIAPINKSELPSTFFMPWFECWGWGTWKRSWMLFNRNPSYQLKKSGRKDINFINVYGSDPSLWHQVIDNYRNKIKTWAIFFHVCICEHKGLVLYPKESLCRNIGFDGSGTNCNIDCSYDVKLANQDAFMLPDPDKIEPNEKAVSAFIEFNKGRIKPFDRFVYFIWRWLFILFKH